MSWDGPTLLDSFERDGEWWLPGDGAPEKVFGRVSFDPAGGVRLKTLRPFPEEGRHGVGRGFRPPLILGFWGHGTPVTLYRTTRVGTVRPPGSNFGSEFYARYAVDGHHFYAEEDAAFFSLRAGFTDLEEWAKHHPFAGTIPVSGNRRTGYVEMKPVEVEVGSLLAKLTVRSDMKSWALVPMKTLRWEHRVVFEIAPEEEKPPRWYRDVLGGLQDLLTLLVGRPVYPSAAEAQVRRGGSRRADLFFDGGSRQPGAALPSARLSRGSDVLLPLPQIRHDLPRALESWFAKRELLSPVYDLFFGVLFGPDVGPEYQFLSLAQALETYHRRTRPESRYLEEAEYGRRYEEIVEALPGDLPRPLKSKLKDVLKYGNEWSLRKRVTDLLDGLPSGVVEDEGGDFVEAVVNTRNYLTHYTEELRERALQGTVLSEALDELRRVVAFLLFQELGLDEQKVVAALDRVPRHEYFSLED